MAKGLPDTAPRSRGTPPRASESPKAHAKSAPAEPVKHGKAAPAKAVKEATPPKPVKQTKAAPAKAAKKAPGAKEKPALPAEPQAVEAPKSAAPKKKTAAPKGKSTGKTRAPAQVGIEAESSASSTADVTEARSAPEAPAPVREAQRPPARQEAESTEAELTRLERAAQLGLEEETRREIEKVLAEPVPPGPVDVPGFETVEAPPEASATPDAPDPSAPSELFFTAASPGAEPPRMGARVSGLFSLAKEIAFQTLASERLNRTVVSARGMVGAALTSLGLGGSTTIDEYGKDAVLGGVLQPVLDFLYEHYWRVSVQGASHVPAGPVLLVANHSGALPFDGPMLQQALSRERPDLQEARWLAEDQVFHAPMMGTLMNRLGAVRACPENALRLLDELRPVIVFPEGSQGMGKPFAQRYQLKRFGRGGFVKLALRTGAPIVPVAIVGAEETVPLLGKLPAGFLGLDYLPVTLPPLPARWMLRFGEPISMGDLPPEAAEDLSQVQRLTERTRESIQGMLQALLKERRSVFSG